MTLLVDPRDAIDAIPRLAESRTASEKTEIARLYRPGVARAKGIFSGERRETARRTPSWRDLAPHRLHEDIKDRAKPARRAEGRALRVRRSWRRREWRPAF